MKFARFSVAVALVALLAPLSVFAASVTSAPVNVSTTAGKTFSVTLTADPAGAALYTVSAHVSFNASVVQLVGFSFAPKWVALSESGYDVQDNSTGTLIKTAGYPGGVTASTVFGTATFRAVKTGNAAITVTSSSLALDRNGKNQVSGAQGATNVVVSAPVIQKVTPAPKPKSTFVAVPKARAAAAPTVATASAATTTETVASSTATSSLAAAAAAANTGGSMPEWLWIVLAVAVIGIIIGAVVWYRRKMSMLG